MPGPGHSPGDAVLRPVLRLRLHITAPDGSACKAADPANSIRDAIHAVLPGLPFAALDVDGASVKLVREGETSNVERIRLD
ncbi:hypothetical protein E2562_021239 [Oryza meyeriana var. granulata]|uniref:Uncharacterized protein n=1 Tax=Oryza meyeriana var. granulata TaxID=110450 RepID=A0A6G1DZT0_9ORYZ|nr:hypothetical protein E2562_021239 [Oryza meyeriana var. granulata]